MDNDLDTLEEELSQNIYFEEKKFKAPLMAGDLVFQMFNIKEGGINRGFLVTNDNKEIYRFNGGCYTPDGEDFIKDKMQKILGKTCNTHYKNEVIEWVKDNQNLRIDREVFNEHLKLINLENGIYNLETKELEEHSSGYFLTYQILQILICQILFLHILIIRVHSTFMTK